MLDELEWLVSNEHLLHLLGESLHDRVAGAGVSKLEKKQVSFVAVVK